MRRGRALSHQRRVLPRGGCRIHNLICANGDLGITEYYWPVAVEFRI